MNLGLKDAAPEMFLGTKKGIGETANTAGLVP